MTESILGKLGFRRASGVDEAGWGRTLAVAVVAFIYFLPVLFIIFTAFKPQGDALLVPPTLSPTSLFGLIPDHFVFKPTLENFGSVFSRSMTSGGAPEATGFDRYFFNSIFIASASVLLALVIGTLAAFGFSRYPLKGNDTYLFIILTTRMLPAIVVIIPVILMFRVVGLSGSYLGIIMLYTAFNLAFTIWMMKSFFDELSPDVEDAARLDGSSGMRVFFKICLPQVIAGLAATFVFGLILTWNEFLFALLLSGPDTRTVPVAMNQAVSSGGRGTDWTLLAAIETLFLVPVFLVTFFLQNHLLRGVTFGTVKR
ncbi:MULTISPECIES: carbohydrate ABC transporter permease [unclassified Mesorhizobium]|uniref:carbohydrate ABC transporter permease n=1 Tax=unclassified Mesorhizobium TaxID=325217 RepID=UPI0003CE70A7|nr:MULTISPECIES: carbohydrate ABC transporter permease [unclassified Mesorhizobium]ESX94362.1 sugar ABC transporter permease [Mesorhizobium sp. LNJC403B00]ESY02683.1 sugar ABC transporter permease [Mesorhizobium sp. LNJC405B00]ESY13212.1 sugar ABC transporter permease [Mesorhizobium sp. LNJC398B00]ESY37975.1 sugar ABC transporter permease [Mesorhizobium sp. LNJC386A00]ESY55200.1 sugar ABC transporter permease [Mesorhizobium sp. LNJC374B00]